MKRRNFFKLSAVTVAWLLNGCSSSSNNNNRASFTLTNYANSSNKLIIPSLLTGKDIDGVKHYDLNIKETTHTFFDGFSTSTYGINGSYLGPTLKLINGDNVSINYTNNLNEPTTMHGHGMHVPANMDGAVHQTIGINQTWSAKYKVNQRASTNWYHPHLMGKTAEHVYRGLAGLIIVEDDEINNLDLPKEYGVDDIPLVLQDRFFNTNGQIDYSPNMREIMMGYNGDIFLANGVYNAYIDVQAKEVRFRILNGSNSTVYNLKFSDARIFKQIATDNSLLETPVSLSSLRLSPAERAEIVVDFSLDLNKTVYLQDLTQNKNFLKINITTTPKKITTLPNKLTTLEYNSTKSAVRTRTFTLSAFGPGDLRINGRSMNKDIINERVPINEIEIWEVTNAMHMNHNFHIHATYFTIVERNGSSSNVLDNEKGYKDTVFLAPNDKVKLIVKMTDYTDNINPYMYHCHFLEHEDAGMMGQFTVEQKT